MSVGHIPIRWITTCLILPVSFAGDWTVHVPTHTVYALSGSAVTLPCSYDFPEKSVQSLHHKVLSEMWCLGQSYCITPRYVYHSKGISPEPAYQGRVEYLGVPGSKNCSLKISNMRTSDSGVYVFRFITDHPVAKLPGQPGVTLVVTDPPKNTTVMVISGEIVVGAPLTLMCSSQGEQPVKNYTWFKIDGNGIALRGSGQNYTTDCLRPKDNGKYMCVATNRFGTDNATITITVQNVRRDSIAIAVPLTLFTVMVIVIVACVGGKVITKSHQPEDATQDSF
ncbi:V-set and immunoglobulin domain-containing protein 1 [Chanos chanos]|uniref:V-set and immunoglobulin domain-containing protein 1 n=1 Tax=Chanos chanos TaxID=29144 RepID=UPI0011F0AB64|nr:V-set and immunoglobulin domain-containing protein 1-like [Chanos chanos]